MSIGGREEGCGQGHAQKRNHANGKQSGKALSNPNVRLARIAVNSRQSAVDSQGRHKGIHSEQLTVESGNLQKQFLFGFVFSKGGGQPAKFPGL
jgi:hypothetical protein